METLGVARLGKGMLHSNCGFVVLDASYSEKVNNLS